MVQREQYKRLEQHLRTDARPRIEMTFADVALVIGEQLPRSAYQHPAWWGSDPKHTQAVWLDAGYVASPNLTAEKVTFTRKSKKEPSTPVSQAENVIRLSRAEGSPARPIASTSREQLPGRIFMSYRREDTSGYAAGWLFDQLAKHFGADQVFKDVDSIELGDDFVEAITSAVTSCDALLALIGERWVTITDEDGRRRLDNPDDFVRLEIETALTRNVRVIPILVSNARMPRSDELPPSLAKLVRRQALELSPRRFVSDTAGLIKVLEKTLAEVRNQPPPEAQHPHGAKVNDMERQWHRAMVAIYETAKRELGYNATRFLQMLSEQGGLLTAKQLLWSDRPSDGFTTLWEHHRLELTVEAHVLHDEFRSLFTDEDRRRALNRLEQYGWPNNQQRSYP